ncbi:MAG TPA: class I SAM-dependent methyltransferase [Pyrinomonadaceae bacterium]|nr:class I SAM-dependent methyltransferase [Pyrinomonadaceae bacterium]
MTSKSYPKLTARQCPACKSTDHFARGIKNGFEMITCHRCRTLYTSQLPEAEQGEDYETYYHENNLTAPDFINRRLNEIMRGFASYRQNGRLLDIGFGAGTLLEAARRAGWEAQGVEVAGPAIEQARMNGFKVFQGILQDAHYPSDYFDVVTASEVLEHVPDPQPVLNEIARVLRPGGLIWMTTPHGRGLSARILGLKWSIVSPPEHLQLFSLSGGQEMLATAGLRPVRVATEGVNPFELLNAFRREKQQDPATAMAREGNERVASSYQLNEALMASSWRRMLKETLNGMLNLGRLGDSLKIWAEK